MPKRKVRQPVDRSRQYLTILTNLAILHSPCVSQNCEVKTKHCSGCNESYPCKSRQILEGKTVNQINRQIDEMLAGNATVTIEGDQALPVDDQDEDVDGV